MMGSHLYQVLRSLCFHTGWKYAVFWKLRHRSRMILTCNDAYYDNSHHPERKWCNEIMNSAHDGPISHDPLGLAVAKMSYQVYSLGEGIIGKMAVSGKHSWVFLDKHVADSECFDGWQDQRSAGIKTIAVVAVIPHGVIQLGSLHNISEDLKLVSHIRHIFSTLQDSVAGFIPRSRQNSMESSCLPDISRRTSSPDGFNWSSVTNLNRLFQENEMNLWSQMFPSLGRLCGHSYFLPPPEDLSNSSAEVNVHERPNYSVPGFGESQNSLTLSSENIVTKKHKPVERESFTEAKCEGGIINYRDSEQGSENVSIAFVKDTNNKGCNSHDVSLPTDNPDMDMPYLPSESLDQAACKDQGVVFCAPELNMQLNQDLEKNLESNNTSNRVDSQIKPINFAAGYELYEVLGPAFQKQTNCDKEAEETGSEMVIEISEGMGSSDLLIANHNCDHLLDAVVANISRDGDDVYSEKSLLTAEKTMETCKSEVGTISSAGYSLDQDSMNSLNSSVSFRSFRGFSSASSSRGSEYSERAREPVKITKKRARPGESCRPRPRDRQLIQDRIKELRELVPNGSKCSIDSLLERTIKHMLFMQSTTRHVDKLNRCLASKLLDKDMSTRSSCHEQGSSWAVEVGNNPKACPIVVENVNMNGQMLVKMICEEHSSFLEVAEAIRSLGLTILKGATEAYGSKTSMCFIVEGQNDRSLHRMDVLWSLMQILQPEIIN